MLYLPAIYLTLFTYSYTTTAQSYQTQIDSLKQVLEETPLSPEKVIVLNKISESYMRIMPDSVLPVMHKALALAKQLDDKRGIMTTLKNKATGHYLMGHPYDSILLCQKESVQIAEAIGDYETIARWNNNIGIGYKLQGNYPKALDNLLSALEALNQHVEKPLAFKAIVLGNIGELFVMIDEPKRAQVYFAKALSYAQEHGFEQKYAVYIHDYAMTLYQEGKTEQALAKLEEAIEVQTKVADYQSLVQAYTIYADCLLKENRHPEARIYAEQAYETLQAHKITNELPSVLSKLSEIELADGNIIAALAAAEEAYAKLKKRSKAQDQIPVLHTLGKVRAKQGNYEKAFELEVRAQVLQDSVQNQNNRMNALIASHQERERELIELKNTQLSLAAEKLDNRIKNLLLFGLSVLFAMVLLFFFRSLRHSKVLKQKNEELDVARKEALAASEAKQEFLSTMSHEIRTPMNAVAGFTDILLMDKPRPAQMNYLKNLKRATEYLTNLLNDILDYSKIEAQKVVLEKTPFDLEQELNMIIEIFKVSNQKDKVDIQLNFQADLQHKVLGDPIRLKQILANLIGNAIKFTTEGYVHCNVKTLAQTEENIQLLFEVKDSGIGIAKEKHELIFEDFSQASKSTTRKFGGSGLGLSITKQLLNLYGSRIQLDSKTGEGSNFYFELSLPLTEQALKETIIPLQQTDILSGKKILLAEDNVFNQKVAKTILERYGVDVTIAENGKIALQYIHKMNFDLILMDVHMPEMDGIEAIKHIRAMEQPKRALPIVALSAASTEEFYKYPNLEYIDYVPKPFKTEKLIRVIQDNLMRA